MNAPTFLCFLRCNVEAENASPFLSRWGKSKLPRGKKLARLMGTFSFFVDGYNDDPEEIFAIQAVRDFYAAIHKQWPYWFFFCDLENESLKMIAACLLRNVAGHKIIGAPSACLVLEPLELLSFISAGFSPMNEMFERAGMSEFDIWKRTKAIFEYFGLPFDVPPPR